LSFFINLLALAVPVFVMQVYDRVVFHSGLNTLAGLIVGMGVVLAFDFLLRQARANILQRVALRIDIAVGRRLFNTLVALPLSFLEQRPAAFWHALFRDVDTVRNTLCGNSALMICDLPFFFLFLLLIFVIAEPVAWVLVLVLPIFAALAWRSSFALASGTGRERRLTLGRDTLISELIAGRTTIKALALDQALRGTWEERHAATIEQAITRGGAADRYATLGNSLLLLTTVAMTSVGALAVLEQQLSIGALIAANMLSGRLLAPVTQLVGNWRAYTGFVQARRRLNEVFAAAGERSTSAVKLARPRGSLLLETVSFTYAESGKPAIDDVRLAFPPGGLLATGGLHAIVGANGSGKSTLLKLMQGLYAPTQGRVLLDGADISQFTRRELASWIGYVPQETVLFEGSLRQNIALRCPEAEDADVIAATMKAGAHGFIVDLADGYAAEVGEAGRRLSAGQRQRLAIARALVGAPPLLILDEPSSHLDRQAEAELRLNLTEIAKTTTIIIVTHSSLLLTACHSITVLDRGRVQQSGSAEQVLPRLLPALRTTTAAVAMDEGGIADAAAPPARPPSRVAPVAEESWH
jgi:ATP-binding cassette subfamily C protein LapB